MTVIKPPGKQATMSQQLLLATLIQKRSAGEVCVIHHITQDDPDKLQMEVERRCPVNGLAFERIYLK